MDTYEESVTMHLATIVVSEKMSLSGETPDSGPDFDGPVSRRCTAARPLERFRS